MDSILLPDSGIILAPGCLRIPLQHIFHQQPLRIQPYEVYQMPSFAR